MAGAICVKERNSGNGGIEAVDDKSLDAGPENEGFLAGSGALPPTGVHLDHELRVAVDHGLDARAQLVAVGDDVGGSKSVGQIKKVLSEGRKNGGCRRIATDVRLDLC